MKVRAKISELTDYETKLTEAIKKQMSKEKLKEFAPSNSPWKLVRIKYDRSSVSWQGEWKKAVKKLKLNWKKEMEKLKKRYTTEIVSLTVEPNEEYES